MAMTLSVVRFEWCHAFLAWEGAGEWHEQGDAAFEAEVVVVIDRLM